MDDVVLVFKHRANLVQIADIEFVELYAITNSLKVPLVARCQIVERGDLLAPAQEFVHDV